MGITVASIMSPTARRIGSSTSLEEAARIMSLHQIRHLPIEEDGDILGVLTEHSVTLSLTLFRSKEFALGANAVRVPTAGEVCTRDPYIVSMDMRVADLALEMSKQKYECALVADSDDAFVGIVTVTDLCRTLHLVLADRP